MFEACGAGVVLHDAVERGTLLADVVSAAGAAHFGVEEEHELVETAKTVSLVEPAVLRQQLGPFNVLLDLGLDSPVFCIIHTSR